MSSSNEENLPKKFPKRFLNKVWHTKYEIVFSHFKKNATSFGYKPTLQGFCDFLEISPGKRDKWSKGQWPSAEDLENIHDRLGFSYRWLITGEGDPFEEGGTLAPINDQTEPLIAEIREKDATIIRLERELQDMRDELKATNDILAESRTRIDILTDEIVKLNQERRELDKQLNKELKKEAHLPPISRAVGEK